MEDLLARLNTAGYELHALSNYPSWWRIIEDKLQPSRYLRWTFISCEGPMKASSSGTCCLALAWTCMHVYLDICRM